MKRARLVSILLAVCLTALSVVNVFADDVIEVVSVGADEAPLLEPPSIQPYATTIVTIDRTRTKEGIAAMARQLPHSGFSSKVTAYEQMPIFTAPYSAGTLKRDDIADALNALKMVRYIAGLPYENINFSDQLNNISQHGAVLLAASNQFSHYPDQPSDMPDSFYEIGYKGCSEANISAGLSNIAKSVLGFIADGGSNNIERAGHRRWILKPGADNFGIGYARNTASGVSYGGNRISMHVFSGLGYWQCESDSYIAWPNSGDFPIQYFTNTQDLSYKPPYPWSINLGAAYAQPNRNSIALTLTRARDGKVWSFNNSTPQLGLNGMPDNSMHLAVDNGGYGMQKAILFRPDVTTLGEIRDGDRFTVNLSGINTAQGQPTTLTYTIKFFDLEKEINNIGTYSLKLTTPAGGSITTGTEGSYQSGTAIQLYATPNKGYTFSHWESTNGGTFSSPQSKATTFTMPSASTTVKANFMPISWKAIPQKGEENVSTSKDYGLRIEFNTEIKPQSASAFIKILKNGQPVALQTPEIDGKVVYIRPAADFLPNTLYVLRLDEQIEAKNSSATLGNTVTYEFKTGEIVNQMFNVSLE